MVRSTGACLLIALLGPVAPVRAASGPNLAEVPAGAASCSGCHALSVKAGSAVPTIYGRPPAEILAALAAFRSGERPATVMNRLAPGFSEAEAQAIASWLGAQRTGP